MCLFWMARERFSFANAMALGEMSRPTVLMCGNLPLLESRECRRREMQPLPEQTSRMRSFPSTLLPLHSALGKGGTGSSEERENCSSSSPLMSNFARWLVYASVSGLLCVNINIITCPSHRITYLGINTPGRHLISSSPKGCEPRIYCKGSALDRRLQSCTRRFLANRGHGGLVAATCSVSQRSSLIADGRSRVPRRTSGRSGDFLDASWRRECGRRGMSLC